MRTATAERVTCVARIVSQRRHDRRVPQRRHFDTNDAIDVFVRAEPSNPVSIHSDGTPQDTVLEVKPDGNQSQTATTLCPANDVAVAWLRGVPVPRVRRPNGPSARAPGLLNPGADADTTTRSLQL